MPGKWFGHHQCTLCWHIPAALTVRWTNIAKQYSQTVVSKSTGQKSRIYHVRKSSRVQTNEPNECALCVWPTMEDWTHKPHVRQGGCPFSSNPIAKTFHSLEDQTVGKGELLSCESQSSSNIARVGVWVVNQWSVMDSNYFSPYIFWPKICPRSFQATHACHSEVSNRFK